jgi:hypothetical protein
MVKIILQHSLHLLVKCVLKITFSLANNFFNCINSTTQNQIIMSGKWLICFSNIQRNVEEAVNTDWYFKRT